MLLAHVSTVLVLNNQDNISDQQKQKPLAHFLVTIQDTFLILYIHYAR